MPPDLDFENLVSLYYRDLYRFAFSIKLDGTDRQGEFVIRF